MWSIPVILFGIFIAADAKGLMSLFTKKRDVLDLDNYHCWVGRHECFRTLQQYEDTFGDLEHLNELLEASFLDQLCQDLSSLKACNADLLAEPGCDIPYIREQTDREDAVADYICKDKTKRLIMAMKDSPCLTDVSTLLQMEGEVSDCDRHLYQNPRLYEDPGQEVCIIEELVKPCLVGKAMRLCGKSVVELGLDAWENLKPELLPPADCSSKRSLVGLLRETAKRHYLGM